jgi:hypothetical protein
LRPKDAGAHFYHGLALARLGRLTEARASLMLARLHRPLLAPFTDYNIALIDAQQSRYKEALRPLRRLDDAFKGYEGPFAEELRKRTEKVADAERVQASTLAIGNAVTQADADNAASFSARPSNPRSGLPAK